MDNQAQSMFTPVFPPLQGLFSIFFAVSAVPAVSALIQPVIAQFPHTAEKIEYLFGISAAQGRFQPLERLDIGFDLADDRPVVVQDDIHISGEPEATRVVSRKPEAQTLA